MTICGTNIDRRGRLKGLKAPWRSPVVIAREELLTKHGIRFPAPKPIVVEELVVVDFEDLVEIIQPNIPTQVTKPAKANKPKRKKALAGPYVTDDQFRAIDDLGLAYPESAGLLSSTLSQYKRIRVQLGLPQRPRSAKSDPVVVVSASPGKCGRRDILDPTQVRLLVEQGLTDGQIAQQLQCARDTAMRARQSLGLPGRGRGKHRTRIIT
jgi:hypothetical protein